jgi:hypothetical protein
MRWCGCEQGENDWADHGVPLVMAASGRRGVDFSPAMQVRGAWVPFWQLNEAVRGVPIILTSCMVILALGVAAGDFS